MSKDEIENSQIDVIETEVDAPIEDQKIEPVVIKKGSFLTFVAFLLSASALALSAYQYYQSQDNVDMEDKSTWQAPFTLLETETSNNAMTISELSNQVVELKQVNAALQEQISSLEKQGNNTVAEGDSFEKFDDSLINQQLADINDKVVSQQQGLSDLLQKISSNQREQSQVTQEIKDKIENNKNLSNASPVDENDYVYDKTKSLLQAAHIQLNIKNNPNKAVDLLTKARTQMAELPNIELMGLSEEISEEIENIVKIKVPDSQEIKIKIKAIASASSVLSFNQNPGDASEQSSSWYDKLVVIRQVDENQTARLSLSEQQNIYSLINSHFDILTIALMNNNADIWREELDDIEKLLNQNFGENAKGVIAQLIELKEIDINPSFPNLNTYMKKFEMIHIDNKSL